MRRTTAVVAVVVMLGSGCSTAAEAGCRLRIVNYNVAKLNSENPDNRNCVPGSLSVVFAALNDDDRPGFATAPHVYVCQEVGTADSTALLDLLNAVAPSGVTYALGTYTSNGETAGAQAIYFREDTFTENTGEHLDIPTGANRNADRWKLGVGKSPTSVEDSPHPATNPAMSISAETLNTRMATLLKGGACRLGDRSRGSNG